MSEEEARPNPLDLGFLLDATRRLNRTLDLDRLLYEIRDLAKQTLSAEACSLLLYNEDHSRLEFYLAYDHIEAEGRRLHLLAGEGLAGWIASHGEAVLANDVSRDPRFRFRIDRALGFTTRQMLGVPLSRGGVVIGVLAVLNKHDAPGFTEEDRRVLETLAGPIAFALDNALLFRAMEREKAENEALYKIGLILSQKLELQEILEVVLDRVADVVPYNAGAVYLMHWDTRELEWFAHRGYPDATDERVRLKLGDGAVGWVAKTGQPLVIPDVSAETHYVNARPTTRSEVVVPVVSQEKVIGVLNLESDTLDAFRNRDLRILTSFAAQAGISIQRAQLYLELQGKQRLEDELRIAREIQQSFLPAESPALPGFELAGANLSSKEVSGDSFDYVPIAEDQLGIMVGDVSGKGVPAALILASFRASLRAEIRNNYSIAEILQKVNQLLCESIEPGKFVTAVYGVLDVSRRVFTYANAGHDPPLWIRPRHKVRGLSEGGLILGSFPEATYQEGRVELKGGDLLVFYTDGVTDAGMPERESFGPARLLAAVEKRRALPAARIVEEVLAEIEEYAGESAWADDRTMVVLKALTA